MNTVFRDRAEDVWAQERGLQRGRAQLRRLSKQISRINEELKRGLFD
jgi:hypothetical protein